ncbi:MAG: UDP-glucose/GDP-mannose dehydrogenase family protein [Gemmataceae bacterium]|nr:UDP-glucose/GDP-mannose dehydrogenase family protein [Gemmataceae bacterium]
MKIAVIGSGYVGLVTAACLADSGNDVVGVDIDAKKIDLLNSGGVPIYEPGLQEMIARNRDAGRLSFTTRYEEAVPRARIIFIAVGTPESKTATREADLSYVWSATEQIAAALNHQPVQPGSKIVLVKSTVPVGTNARVLRILEEKGCRGIDVASNPEFLKEGAALDDFQKPDRVVVGVRRPEVAEIVRELYAPFLRTERPFLVMSPESAELTKYAANAMLATKISFINQIANLCDRLGADINDVRRGIGHDARIGFQFLFPGPGYGGSCFPKDVREIVATASKVGMDLTLMRSVDAVNEAQKMVLPEKILRHFGPNLAGKCLAIWGLAFKPRTDDIREAPSLVLIRELLSAGASLRLHDPEALDNVREYVERTWSVEKGRVVYCDKPYGALEGVNGLALVTEWSDYRNPDFELMRRLMAEPVIFDGRNVYEPAKMAEYGFIYYGIGRGRRSMSSVTPA